MASRDKLHRCFGFIRACVARAAIPICCMAACAAPQAGAADAAWMRIASEHQAFSVSGTQTVRYGAGGSWIAKSVTGAGQCSNAYFGSDPAYGIVKECDVAVEATAWTRIASEHQAFSVSGTQIVRYGAAGSWIAKSVTGSGQCSNAYFGSDPAYGSVKECDVADAWTTIARENESFSVSGTQTVRYGSGSSWITKSVTGSGQCSNAFFLGDPAYGIVKACQVLGSAAAPPTVAQVCTPPITASGTTGVAPSVGNGTAASCTESALRAAIASHPVVTFNCGAAPVRIGIARTIDLPTDRSTVIDGGNKVTLDGGGTTRIFRAVREDYRRNQNIITLQHITLARGKAAGTQYVPPNPANPSCAYGWADGQGGAILVRDTRLRAIDTTFVDNAAATPGPDVGGGAIYVMGSLEATVVGSIFIGNSGSNAGAVGLLQTDARIYNSLFRDNVASGTGQNFMGGAANGCPGVGHANQGGAGGNGGAVSIDGRDDVDAMVCGTVFSGNRANELGGALFRTINGTRRRTTLDRSLFRANTAKQAGAVFVAYASPLEILATTFDANVAKGGAGGVQAHGSKLAIVNSTFSGNLATAGLGGALFLSATDPAGIVQNATFAGNLSPHGLGYFSAAIAGTLNFPVYNTVFANNLTNDGGSPMQCSYTIPGGANDVQWPRNRVVGGVPDTPCVTGIVFADPHLGPLAANGGPTPTAAPSATSPLRGAGRNCPATDQRGVARNTSRCTIGAVE